VFDGLKNKDAGRRVQCRRRFICMNVNKRAQNVTR
jgi:hypothetical protein